MEHEPLIRCYFMGREPVLTVEEFEQIERELVARALAGDVTMGDSILASLIELNRGRYLTCKVAKESKKDPE